MKFVFLFLALFGSTSQQISYYREAYISQDENRILKCLNVLEEKKNKTELEQCYYAVFLCLKADYSYNPYTKYKSFTKGYALLQDLIKSDTNNLEYRYHRYMIEKNAPDVVLSKRHLSEDRAMIKRTIKKSHPLYDVIIKTVY